MQEILTWHRSCSKVTRVGILGTKAIGGHLRTLEPGKGDYTRNAYFDELREASGDLCNP